MKTQGLNFKMNVYLLSSLFGVLAIMLAVIVINTSKQSKKQAKEYVAISGLEIASKVEKYLDLSIESTNTIAQLSLALKEEGNTSRDLYLEMLKKVLENNPNNYATWTMWEKNAFDGKDQEYAKLYNQEHAYFTGSYYRAGSDLLRQQYGEGNVSTDDLEEYNEDYYSIAKESKKQAILEPYYYSFTGEDKDERFMTSVATPILYNGQVLGVVGTDIDLSVIQNLVDSVSLYQTGFASLMTNDHMIATHRNKDYIEKSTTDIYTDQIDKINEVIKAGGTFGYETDSEDGDIEVFRYITPIRIGNSETPWSVMIEVPTREINAETQKMSYVIVIIGLIGLIIIAVVIFLISKSITNPIESSVALVKEIAEGKLNTKITLSGRSDELGDLEKALSIMTTKLSEVVNSIKSGSETIASASQQLSSTSEQLSQGASEQASSVEEVSATTEEIATNIQQNSENAQKTERISSAAQSGIANVSEMSNKTAEATKVIADKIQVINDIAFQTNILALNAAVEAARAGDQGRGFSVVAAEVRKLAERSKVAAEEIVSLTNSTLEIAQDAGGKMFEMLPEIEETTRLVQEIAAASIEQNTGTDQVNSALQQLNDVTQQNAAASEMMASNAESLSAEADTLKRTIAFFDVE